MKLTVKVSSSNFFERHRGVSKSNNRAYDFVSVIGSAQVDGAEQRHRITLNSVEYKALVVDGFCTRDHIVVETIGDGKPALKDGVPFVRKDSKGVEYGMMEFSCTLSDECEPRKALRGEPLPAIDELTVRVAAVSAEEAVKASEQPAESTTPTQHKLAE